MKKIFLYIILINSLLSVEINGNGTTVANFLEIDIGSAATPRRTGQLAGQRPPAPSFGSNPRCEGTPWPPLPGGLRPAT